MNNIKQIQGQLHKYEIEELVLGMGTYGKVYRGKKSNTDQYVAIKILKKAPENQIQLLRQAQKQCEALENLRAFPNIVRFIEIIYFKCSVILVFQYCRHGNLFNRIVNSSFGSIEAKQVLTKIIEGYINIKRAGFLHRDIKPSNILIDNRDIKICDFGFAIPQKQAKKRKNQNVGSIFHMSPQIIEKNEYSIASDIWAIGVTYYQMLIGQYLWVGRNMKEVLEHIRRRPVQSAFCDKMDDTDKTILKQCLSPDPDKRASPEFLLQILQPFSLESSEKEQCPKKMRVLYNFLDLCKIQAYLISLIASINTIDNEAKQIFNVTKILHVLLNEVNKRIKYLKQAASLYDIENQDCLKLFVGIEKIQQKIQGYQGSKQQISGIDSIDKTLVWLHNNVKEDQSYWLFILYDYLVTYRWLWNLRYRKESEQDKSFIEKNQLNVNEILNSLKKQLLRNKKISNKNLEQLSFKLKKLGILPRSELY